MGVTPQDFDAIAALPMRGNAVPRDILDLELAGLGNEEQNARRRRRRRRQRRRQKGDGTVAAAAAAPATARTRHAVVSPRSVALGFRTRTARHRSRQPPRNPPKGSPAGRRATTIRSEWCRSGHLQRHPEPEINMPSHGKHPCWHVDSGSSGARTHPGAGRERAVGRAVVLVAIADVSRDYVVGCAVNVHHGEGRSRPGQEAVQSTAGHLDWTERLCDEYKGPASGVDTNKHLKKPARGDVRWSHTTRRSHTGAIEASRCAVVADRAS